MKSIPERSRLRELDTVAPEEREVVPDRAGDRPYARRPEREAARVLAILDELDNGGVDQ